MRDQVGIMTKRPLIAYFALTFAITWGLGACFALFPSAIIAVFGKPSLANPLFVLAVYAPSISAIVVTAIFDGFAGVGALLRRLAHWRFGAWWYLAIFGGAPALSGAAVLLHALVDPGAGDWRHWPLLGPDGQEIAARLAGGAGWAALPMIVGIVFLTDPGPLGEELGWRGFALPRMIEDRKWVLAGILLGIVWGLWHLPAFLIGGLPQSDASLPVFMVSDVAGSVLMAWIFVGTRGSVLAAVIVHFMLNICLDMTHEPLSYYTAGVLVAAALLVGLFFGNMAANPATQLRAGGTA
jgi:membrane protease YdiL (CAAX protease family)